MANRKISELPAAESQDLTGANSLLHVVNPDRASTVDRNRKATWSQVKDALVAQDIASDANNILASQVFG